MVVNRQDAIKSLLCIAATSALEAGGNREDIIQRLLSSSAANPEISPLIDNGGADSSTNNVARESISNEMGGEAEQDSEMKDEAMDEIANEGSTSGETNVGEDRDSEIEEEIADEIAQVDALSAYDISLDREIEAINEYLGMLDASQDSA